MPKHLVIVAANPGAIMSQQRDWYSPPTLQEACLATRENHVFRDADISRPLGQVLHRRGQSGYGGQQHSGVLCP